MKVGIVGAGVVGRATARTYLEYVEEVRVYDVIPERKTHSLSQILGCDIVFVCLPTPQKPNSLEMDLSAIEQFFTDLTRFGSGPVTTNLVLRSTVPIGTTKRLRGWYKLSNLVHSPEFLTARVAVTDAMLPARNIIGQPGLTSVADGNKCFFTLEQLYKKRFPGVPCFLMDSDESEAVKLILNSFFSLKVAYFNCVKQLSDKLGLDWQRVLEGILSDGRVGFGHTQVPGPDGRLGFGGACLRKDLACLTYSVVEEGLDGQVLLSAINTYNEIVRGKE